MHIFNKIKPHSSLNGLFLVFYPLAGLVYALSNLQMGGYDLVIYREVATRALNNAQPYSHPYADFPPLKLFIFTFIEQGGLAGWFFFMVALYMLFGLVAYFFIRTFFPGSLIRLTMGLILLFLPGIYAQYWLQIYEDKVIYVILILALLIFMRRRNLVLSSLFLGLLQGYGGFGFVMFPALLLWWYYQFPRTRNRRTLFEVMSPFVAVSLASHLLYFPDWIHGYQLRSTRTIFLTPAHTSIFQIPYKLWGLYHPALPNLLTFAGIIACYLLIFVKRKNGSEEAFWNSMLLIYFCWLAFGPEAGFDRILAACLPLLLYIFPNSFKFTTLIVVYLLIASWLIPVYSATPLALAALWLIPGFCVTALLFLKASKLKLNISQLKVINPDRLGGRTGSRDIEANELCAGPESKFGSR